MQLAGRCDESSIGTSGSIPGVLQEFPNPAGTHVGAVRFQRLEVIEDALCRVVGEYTGYDFGEFRVLNHTIHPLIWSFG